jgi:hypothetical protein
MSLNPLSHVSQIWSRATTALSNTPDAGSAMARVGTGRSGQERQASAAAPSEASASTPFATLASNLQSVLLQLQANQPQSGPQPGQSSSYPGPSNPPQSGTGSLSTLA